MTDDFPSSLAHVLTSEGGWSDDPKDPGGPTMEGVTQKEYDIWRTAHRLPVASVRGIDPNEVEAIYRGSYWTPSGADQLPAGVDYCVFDCAVNSGPHQAVRFLQRAVGADDDGAFGPETLAAVGKVSPIVVIAKFTAERLMFLKTLPGWPHDGLGWQRRVNTVRMTAMGMAR